MFRRLCKAYTNMTKFLKFIFSHALILVFFDIFIYDYFLIDVIKSRFIFTQHKERNSDFSVIRDQGFAGYNSTYFFVSASNEIQPNNDDSMNYVKDLTISLVGNNCFKSIQPMYGRNYRLVLSC